MKNRKMSPMAEVEIRVNGRDYRVTCEDGQEDRLNQLAAYYDRQVSDLASELGQIGDARLLLLSALTICDELFEENDIGDRVENQFH